MTAQHSLSSCFLKTLLHLNMLSWDVWLPVRSTRLCVGGVDISSYGEISKGLQVQADPTPSKYSPSILEPLNMATLGYMKQL
jgi:hypothetical protein